MSTYRMSDGSIVNTDSASQSWDEETRWNGKVVSTPFVRSSRPALRK
jgi:hypothetical protein